MSMMASGLASAANAMPSPRTRRPSASVLSTSTVSPPRWVMTSPGRVAVPLGMFSARHRYPVTATGRPSSATARTAAATAAAPPMSDFIVIIDAGGLSDRPPESNVMPLPT